ncbi:hypothetical protein QBC34DRAFT_493838 [Podospora aff. communis PSN243]|uniref:Uncharacterized protein n=1 Tax=Podospora aff. communis PSN243 TaxID=3040156 RepID=A0AAV9GSK2_9PEZI|nr:hypothetical protein QBC34DRAFT_493838 [Podospora aff. communis PSN243]
MATTTTLRYSHPNVDASDAAKSFRWEKGVPVTPFWDGLDWVICTHFLRNFTPDQLPTLPIDASNSSNLTTKERTQLLLKILQDKQRSSTSSTTTTTSPSNSPEVTPEEAETLLFSIHLLQKNLGLVSAAGESIRALVAARGGDSAFQQTLAHQLIDEGKYAEAEAMIRPACEEIDASGLGKNSPQGIGFQRTLLEALWRQGGGKRAEAEGVVREVEGRIEGMRGGRFEVYGDAEREELGRLLGELRG